MGTGYTRNDGANNIADGNIINASDLDGEFDAIVSAFGTSGHTHDGTAAEGGAITVTGPNQDFVVSGTEIKPKTTNTLSIGTASLQFKDLYIDGTAYIDGIGEDTVVATDKKVQFRDTAIFINSSVDGQLDIDADTEIEITTGTLDINATATDISGTLNVAGALTAASFPATSLTGTVADARLPASISSDITGNAATATTLATARTIGGVSFNGSANINLPGVNTAGNQNTSGSAATLTTARTIGGVSFNGSANINLPGVNTAGNQNTSGSAATLTTPRNINGVSFNGSSNITIADSTKLPLAGGTVTGTVTIAEGGSIVYDQTSGSGGGGYIPRPAGANFKGTTSARTGAIQIRLPAGLSPSDMLSFHVDLFDYAGSTEGESFSAYIYGYNRSPTAAWLNTGAVITSDRTDRDFTVRFGRDSSYTYVWIGETNSSWTYPQIVLRDFQVGYSADIDSYADGWNIDFVTSFATVDQTSTNNYPVAKSAATLTTTRAIQLSGGVTGTANFDGSAAINIATTIAADAITGAKIANNTINSEHYAAGSIDRVHLAADIIDGTKIANDVINSEHYVAGSIDNEHIADNAINSEHYAAGSIDNEHIADNAINSEHYADGSIDRVHLAADIIDGTKIANDAINSEHYASNSIDALHLNVSGNGTTSQFLRSDGDGTFTWVEPAAGAGGGGSDEIFWENGQNVTTNYTITNGKNAMSAGPITINAGITVTVGAGETWTVI